MPALQLITHARIKAAQFRELLHGVWHHEALGLSLPWLVLLVGLGATYAVWTHSAETYRHELQIKFDLEVQDIMSRIQQRMYAQQQLLHGTAGLFSASQSVERDEFAAYVAALQLPEHFHGVQGIGFSVLVPSQEKKRHITAIRKSGFTEYTMTPDGTRDVYTSIIYLEPFNWRNQRAFGYDMFSEPIRRVAMEQARDTGNAAITGKLKLVQETRIRPQPGFLMYYPVYINGLPHASLTERRAHLVGWVFSPFRMYDLMSGTLGQFDRSLDIHIFDDVQTVDAALIYSAHAGEAEPEHLLNYSVSKPLEFNGHKWLVQIHALPAFEQAGKWDTASILAGSGMALSLLLTLLTWQLVHGRSRAVKLAQQVNFQLRESQQFTAAILDALSAHICVLDTHGVIVTVNKAWRNFYTDNSGDLSQAILGCNYLSVCDTATGPYSEDAVGISSGIRAVINGELTTFIAEYPCHSPTEKRWFKIIVTQFRNEHQHIVLTHEDITERKLAEEALSISEERWKFALEGSDQGVWDWNIPAKQVFFSRRWKEMLGYSEDEIGSDLSEWENRVHPDDIPKVMADVQAYFSHAAPTYINEHRVLCKDGSYKWILDRGIVVSRDESGNPLRMIGTHSDITARKEAERSIQENEARLRAILDNSPFLIWLKDKEGRYLAANQAWLKTAGYSDMQHIYGKTDYDIWPKDLADKYRTDDAEVMASGKQKLTEERALDGDKEYWSETFKTPIIDTDGNILGTTGFARDITEKKTMEAAIRESQEKVQTLFENTPVATMAVDPSSGKILQANQKCLQLFGYSMEEFGKLTVQDITVPVDIPLSVETMEALASGKINTAEIEKRYIRKDGSVFWGDVDIATLRDNNEKNSWNIAAITDITFRKIAEQQLRAASEYSRSLIEASPDPLVTISPDGKLTDVNRATERMTGYDRNSLLGQDFSNYFTDPEDARNAYHRVLGDGYVTDHPLSVRHRDGHVTQVLYNASLYHNEIGEISGVFAATRDISQQKMIEEALRENQHYLLLMLETSPIAVRIAGSNGSKVLFANQSYVDLINSSRERVIGTTPINYYANPQDYKDILAQLNKGIPVVNKLVELHIPADINHTEEKTMWAMASYMRMDYQGEPAVLGWFYDVTELRRAKEMAEDMAKVKAEFLANMSHEIRTPMNAIIGLSQLALNRETTPDIRDYLTKINHSSNSLLGILNDILDLSKTESGHMTIEQSDFDLGIVLANVRNMFVTRAEEKFLDFVIDVASDIPHNVVGDALRLQQILTNLLGNAFKFTEHGSVTLKVSTQARDDTHATILFSVSDTGIGIAQENIPKLCQPFVQADNSVTRRFGGTGLGLTISKKLLELMDSEFQVHSTPGKGSTFSFALKLKLSENPARASKNQNNSDANSLGTSLKKIGASLSGIRVLLAEDHEINQQVIEEYLKLSGVSVVLASNGKEALEMLEKRPFDAILMDVHMPEMDGLEATRIIRKQPQFAHLPILAISAGVSDKEHQDCLDCGMNDFVSKPVKPEELLATLSRWVSAPNQHAKQDNIIPGNTSATDTWIEKASSADIDVNKLLASANHDVGLAFKLLLAFAEEMQNTRARLDSTLAKLNYIGAAELANRVKLAAGQVGAANLYAVADSLEDEFRVGQISPVTLARFDLAFESCIKGVLALQVTGNPAEL